MLKKHKARMVAFRAARIAKLLALTQAIQMVRIKCKVASLAQELYTMTRLSNKRMWNQTATLILLQIPKQVRMLFMLFGMRKLKVR